MIRTASAPLRISFTGGGSDLPVFTQRHTGHVVGAAISHRLTVGVQDIASSELRIRSRDFSEIVASPQDLSDPLVREVLKEVSVGAGHCVATSCAIAAGTGLGTSSAFTLACLQAILGERGVSGLDLPWLAYGLETRSTNGAVGSQDMHIIAHGGVVGLEIDRDRVSVSEIEVSVDAAKYISENVALFSTGRRRSTHSGLRKLRDAFNETMVQQTIRMAENSRELAAALREGRWEQTAAHVRRHWDLKRALNAPDSIANQLFEEADGCGVEGFKSQGASGGGYVLALGDKKSLHALRSRYASFGIQELAFEVTREGVRSHEVSTSSRTCTPEIWP